MAMKRLGFDKLIDAKASRERDLVAGRIIAPEASELDKVKAMVMASRLAGRDKIGVRIGKVHTRRLADGALALSFTRLLGQLATIVRNTLRPACARPGEATFDLTTRPNPKQQQALDLIAAIAV